MAFLEEPVLAPAALATGSATFKEARTCATVGDWQRCVEIVVATWRELGFTNDTITAATESPLFRRVADDAELSARLLRVTAMAINCCVAEATASGASSAADSAPVDAMTPLVDALLGLRGYRLRCLDPAEPQVAAALSTLTSVAAGLRKLGLHGVVLELDRAVVWGTTDAEAAAAARLPDGALRRWHAEVFASLDELDVLARSDEGPSDGGAAAEEDASVDGAGDDEVAHSAWAIALKTLTERGVFRQSVRTSADANPADTSESSASPDRCLIGPSAAALVVEMLQRAGQHEKAGTLIANRAVLSRRTSRELGAAYASLIGAWTKTPLARRARAENAAASGAPSSEAGAPNLPWWRGAAAPSGADSHLW